MPKVSVPESVGDEIVITTGEENPKTYRVNDGHITVSAEDMPFVLAHVDGATEAKPASSSKEK